MIDLHHLLEIAKQAALEAGQAIMQVYLQNDFDIQLKSDQSPLTRADREAHSTISRALAVTGIPILSEEGEQVDHAIRKSWEYFWLIDPLDGTKEFISRNGEFTVNIALVHYNKPVIGVVYAPASDTLYAGDEGLGIQKLVKEKLVPISPRKKRLSLDELKQKQNVTIAVSRSHLTGDTEKFSREFPNAELLPKGSSLKFMMLVEGKADVYPRMGATMEWDTAAAHAILNASNRGVYNIDLANELVYNKPELINPYFIAF